jgi:hypothetical protein
MIVSKTRVVYSDVIAIIALGAMYFITGHFTQNVLAISLIILVLVARSIFWHVNWYRQTGKIY